MAAKRLYTIFILWMINDWMRKGTEWVRQALG